MPWDPQRSPANYDLYDVEGNPIGRIPVVTDACRGCKHLVVQPALDNDYCYNPQVEAMGLSARTAYNGKCRGHLKELKTEGMQQP